MKNNSSKEQLTRQAEKLNSKRRTLYASIEGRDLEAADVKPVVKKIHAIGRGLAGLSFLIAQAEEGL